MGTAELIRSFRANDLEPGRAGPNLAQAVAISLHELATNAAKYGSLSVADGSVEIAWSCTADGRLSLRWTEFKRAGRHTADAPRVRHAHF